MAEAPPSAWRRAQLALALLAIDPKGLGGLCLRARSGPARDALLAGLSGLPAPMVRLAPGAAEDHLFGGIDIAATLAQQRVIRLPGAIGTAETLLLPMAERMRPDLAARIALAMDAAHPCILALDEGIEDDALPPVLRQRLAFWIDLEGVALSEVLPTPWCTELLADARRRVATVNVTEAQMAQIVACASQLGIASLRAPQFALRTARAHAALCGRLQVEIPDLQVAADLALSHLAVTLPELPPELTKHEIPEEQTEGSDAGSEQVAIPDDILIEAVRAILPPGLLDQMRQTMARRGSGAGSGAAHKGNRRGRPLPSHPGTADGRARVDLIATLRAAAPWQALRAQGATDSRTLRIWPSDIHLRRYEQKSDRLLIFAVDASGSAAFARLAEAKGAVELLLAQAYARRDHVALIAFRDKGSEILLPPTRSLVQTKRRLAGLPGGGGTPLAAGLKSAMTLALQARARGMTPTVALLTDGRANIALDGGTNRAQARQDAQTMAKGMLRQGLGSIVIDMGTRPEPDLRDLSAQLGGLYLALPRTDARHLSRALSRALEA